jgi:23S rRNA (pseudouridine1915-N3)-methyltransferase
VVGARAHRARGGLTLRLRISAVGRLKAGPETALADDYLRRAESSGRACGLSAISLHEVPESRRPTADERRAEESAGLLRLLPPKAFAIALDERGSQVTSGKFAALIGHHLERGTSDLVFLIGGPDGLAKDFRDDSGLVLSLGLMTWPHRLCRIMLAEQVYRAVTILVNHPYHRP